MKTLLIVLLLSLGLNAKSLSEKTAHGKELYKQCAACHGPYGAHRSLGQSAIINVMSKENIMTALLGYKNGTYGGGMKNLMKGQVARYSYADLEDIVEYVASLKELSSTQQQQYPTNTKITIQKVYTPIPSSAQQQYPPNTRNEAQKASVPIASSPKSEPMQQAWPAQGGIELKVKRYSDHLAQAKTMIKNPMLTKDTARRWEVKQEFITRIVAKEDGIIVFDLISSEYLSKNPILMFKYKSLGASDLSIEATDNNGNKDNLTQPIKEGSNPMPLTETKSTGKEGKPYRVNIPAITKTFGDIEFINTDRIQLVAPDVAANGGAVPVDVFSDIKAKSVTLFAIEENAETKFICQWRINEYSIIDYHVKIKLYINGEDSYVSNLKIIVEGEDGKFYTTEKQVRVAIAGGN